ncbi:hypothetical protein ABQZ99_007000 [Xanthomonas hortorum pv. vitians]|uniref:hypothetical protein n=1 Tax=Xanthomonas hortorum TaxID=56454 RepID=UPI0032E8F598
MDNENKFEPNAEQKVWLDNEVAERVRAIKDGSTELLSAEQVLSKVLGGSNEKLKSRIKKS